MEFSVAVILFFLLWIWLELWDKRIISVGIYHHLLTFKLSKLWDYLIFCLAAQRAVLM